MKISALLPDPTKPLATLSWLTGLRRVAANTAVAVRRLGHFHRSLGPGWHWTVPALEQVGEPVSLIGHHVDVPAATGHHAELYFQILDPTRTGAALERADAVVHEHACAALATLPANLGRRGDADALKSELNRRLDRVGLRVIRCSLHAA
jgi:hypothetical protein